MYRLIHSGFRVVYVAGMAIWMWGWQTAPPPVVDSTVTWKEIVGIALMSVGTLLGLAYRDFSKRMDTNAEGLTQVRDHVTDKLEAIDRRLAAIEGVCRQRTCYLEPKVPE